MLTAPVARKLTHPPVSFGFGNTFLCSNKFSSPLSFFAQNTVWYKGEIGFLDFYIIPLAKKLKDCGVFGVSSDEVRTLVQGVF
jgi:hypothetical protein